MPLMEELRTTCAVTKNLDSIIDNADLYICFVEFCCERRARQFSRNESSPTKNA